MYSGEIEQIELHCTNEPWMISTLYDCFGLDIKVLPLDDKQWIKVTFKSTTPGVVLWATQYCRHSKVIEPIEMAGLKNYSTS